MCRYAMIAYKPHFACFRCRKTFKRRLLGDITDNNHPESKAAKCSDCGELMADMGKDFKAPKKENIKEWKHLERLYAVGITFHSCGCSGPGYIPKTTEQLIKHFEEIKQNYLEELNFWQTRVEPTTKQQIDREKNKIWSYLYQLPNEIRPKKSAVKNQDAREYWISRIKEVEQKIEQVKKC